MSPKTISQQYSMKAFLNSYLRDYAEERGVVIGNNIIELPLGDAEFLKIELEKFSLLGSHKYTGRIWFCSKQKEKEIEFDELVALLANTHGSDCGVDSFMANVQNSRYNLELILKQRLSDFSTELDYLKSEQSLILGHPFHPYPKCKKGMEKADVEKYSPEFQKSIHLFWIACAEGTYILDSDETCGVSFEDIAFFDIGDESSHIKKENYRLLPMHPWQWCRLRSKKFIENKIKNKEIIELGYGKNEWHALSSLRTLYCDGAPAQLKFSMDVTLTNSIRHLQQKEAVRGIQISKVLRDVSKESVGDLEVLSEPSFAGIASTEGIVIPETIVQVRQNLDWKNSFLLATLVEENPFKGFSYLKEKISTLNMNYEVAAKKWFGEFLSVVARPLLTLASEEGVLLGAHMQNIIVQMSYSLPVKAIYRDCQGSGFSKRAYEKLSLKHPHISPKNGNILGDEDTNKVFVYYFVINTVFSVISSIADSESEMERKLLSQFRNFIFNLRMISCNSSIYDFLLESGTLWQKGNFRCCLEGHNENTVQDPWRIYNKIPNPLKTELRSLEAARIGEVYRAYEPKMQKTLSFRVADPENDLEVFHKWHNKKFVSEFWEMDKSREELKEYLLKLLNGAYQTPLIFEVEGEAVGYFEIYWAYDDRIAPYCEAELYDRGLHLLIGEERFLNTRCAFYAILHASNYMFKDCEHTKNLWGEPRSDNQKILKISQALPGWSFQREFDFPHKRSALLKCERDVFFKEKGQL